MHQMFIHLHPSDFGHSQWLISKDEQVIASGNLTHLPESIPEKIHVFTPANDVSLIQATLPKLSRQRLLQAVPFAIEEQLIAEVSELHFAIADYQLDGTLPVAIVAKQTIITWIDTLKDLNLNPTSMTTPTLALPITPDTWCICIYANVAMVRMGNYEGFVCDKNNLATLLSLKLSEQHTHPATIQCRNYTNETFSLQIDNANLVVINLPEKQFLTDLSQWHGKAASINLLQGSYQTKPQHFQNKKIWLIAGYLALAWVGLSLLGNIISLAILHHKNSALETAINQIYRKNFPHASTIVVPKKRMTEKLRKLGGTNSNPLFIWLSAIGKSLSHTSGIMLQQFDYHDHELALQITASNFDSLDKFTKELSNQGLAVKQQNVTESGSQVKGSLFINAGES